MNLNLKVKKQNTYDAIVVGSGISGGWAAKELCEKGLKTIVLERGRNVEHGDYPTAMQDTWDLPNRNRIGEQQRERQAKQSRTGYVSMPSHGHWFVDDIDNPYTEVKRFDWIRGYHVGGRSITWGRQSYRWSDLDFEANAKEGIAVDWPIRYKDIAPWYDYVEKFAGVSGRKEGLSQLPDGQFLPPMELNCVEQQVRERMAKHFDDGRMLTIGRTAHLTVSTHEGRGSCQYRNRCMRGCPYGAYFSSVASTLPAASKTGNLTIRPFSIVNSIIYDDTKGEAVGVRIIDATTNQTEDFFAKVIFLNASAFGSTFIMMNSKSKRFENGFGNDSGELGHNVMDHHFKTGASGRYDGFHDKYYKGRRPNGIYIPRFQNLGDRKTKKDYLRGYGYQGGASRSDWARSVKELSFGKQMKLDLLEPGPWRMGITAFGECLPYHDNKIYLNEEVRDKWGQPTLTMDVEWKENEMKMRENMRAEGVAILEAAGLKDVQSWEGECYPGLGIHEMGTARMGRDPKTSVLNKWNQVHAAKNVFVTDGACMTSAACVNPSLTYMALTARAADYAVKELNRQNI
ncbi:MAG: GMC family oxidoreductase [Bacteroidota bacterium]